MYPVGLCPHILPDASLHGYDGLLAGPTCAVHGGRSGLSFFTVPISFFLPSLPFCADFRGENAFFAIFLQFFVRLPKKFAVRSVDENKSDNGGGVL